MKAYQRILKILLTLFISAVIGYFIYTVVQL